MIDLEALERAVGDRPYVSFDIFDTLIMRPYVTPADLFRHMELLFEEDGFSEHRIKAERQARRKHQREITLNEIYEGLDGRYGHLKDKEIEMEISLSMPNAPMVEVYGYLRKKGKRAVLISDMYLPEEVIQKMLERCHIGYDGLYISSVHGVTKHNGELYDLALEDLRITEDDIFHIGDNRHSDYRVPVGKGIRAFLCERPIDEYFRSHKEECRFYSRKKSLQRSMIVSMDMLNGVSDNTWFDMGRRFGGPLATSYSISVNSKENNRLFLYASRDGHNLKRISEELFPENRTGYVYAQRLLLDVLTDEKLPYGRIDVPNKVSNRYRYEKLSVMMRRILMFFRKELDIIVPDDDEDVIERYNSLSDRIDTLRKEGLSDYTDYIKGMCQDDDIDLIDCTTMKYSSQKLMEKVLRRSVKGHYLVTLEENGDYDHDAMCDWHSPAIGWMNIDIPEFFLCSLEYPLSGWNDGPVFDTSSEDERFRISVYDDVSDGELDYAKRFRSIFGRYMIPFDYWSVVKWSKLSAVRGTAYYDELKKIRWASDPDHGKYMPLITGVGSIRNIVKKLFISVISRINND